ncbi:MAG: T9SS type A sorting domain-containing protein [Ignavibacteriales bacterium]|nr:T9SS type A sorting domain-containing protein [Ignavibacteriales bacterium]
MGRSIGSNEATAYVPAIIPVELISFSSSINENDITLYWQTATETNNQGFQVERRETQDERSDDWNSISFVDGKGTTTEPQSYSFVDENLSAGKYQYRLKQIDFDGTFEYSNTIEIEINQPTKFSLEQNYPNPFNPTTSIQYAISSRQFVSLKVFDVLGKEVATLVNEEKSAGSYEIEFNSVETLHATSLPSGVYFYQLKAGDFIETKKMMLMR